MLGKKIGDFQGRVTSRKVLPSDGGAARVETTAEFEGPILGVAATNIVTYWARMRPDGTLFGEGHGVSMSAQGDMSSWNGQGMGRITEAGGISFRGAVYYQSATGKWAQLNGTAAVYEWNVDGEGNAKGAFWEWK
jgi:hypothetical protein